MRARLRKNDVQFILNLLHKEKERHDRKMEDMQYEIELLEVWIKRWRWRLINWSYYEFKDGLEYMKARLSYLKSQHHVIKMFTYSHALQFLIRRYENLLRGKAGRPLNVTDWGRSDLEEVVKEKMRP